MSESGELFIAGFDGKLHRFVETQSTATEDLAVPRAQHNLGVNFPNPASGETTIPFTLATPGNVELAVFDLLGRKVSVLAEGTYAAGDHVALWNGKTGAGTDLPGGPYFYSLQVDAAIVSTRLLTLVK